MMSWGMLVMQAPLFGGDKTYNAILALVVFIIGAAIYFRAGSKVGWLVMAAALGWAYMTFKELIFM